MADVRGEDGFERIREVRATGPEGIVAALAGRLRRPLLRGDGRLFLVAADHPGRGALAVGSRPMAMADRYELLTRLVRALEHPGVDGVLGTPDILEDLAILGALDDKLAVGSMNRGGLRGASFELDDRYTAYSVPRMVQDGLDAAKALVRIDLADDGTANTLAATADAVSAAADARLPILLEPFLSSRRGDEVVNDLTADAVIRSVAIAAALGSSSAYTWLKLPVVRDMARVMRATTLPTLLLGGDSGRAPEETYASWGEALALPGVRGLVVGRTLLYPGDDDVDGAIDTAARLVHRHLPPRGASSARTRVGARANDRE